MQYGQGKKEMTGAENVVIKQFIDNGGRILLLCPAWVWVAYEKKGLERLSFQQIADNFGIMLTTDYVAPPLRAADPAWPMGLDVWPGTFSSLIYTKGRPILVGGDGRTAAVAREKDGSKIIVWAQNNLLNSDYSFKPAGRRLLKRLFGWLLE